MTPLLKILTAHKPAVFMSWKDRIGWLVHTHIELLTAREGYGSNKQKLLGSFESLRKRFFLLRMPVFVTLI